MIKHRGFPGRLPGTDFQFTIRRTSHARGVTRLVARERYRDRAPADRRADAGFMAALWDYFGEAPFPRGNLDAGRLSWLLGREVVPADQPFDPESYDALLRIDVPRARAAFPEVFDDAPGDGADRDDGAAGSADAPEGRDGDMLPDRPRRGRAARRGGGAS